MNRRARLRRFLAAGVLAVLAAGCEALRFDPDPALEPTAAIPDPAPVREWRIRGGLGTEEEYVRTGGIDESAFWRSNALDPGVAVLPSGLRYRVVRAGTGAPVGDAASVAVNYITSGLDGNRIVDSREEAGGPVVLETAGMNPGWREAVPMMRIGAIWRLYVPVELGRSPSDLGRARSRIYDVEIVGIATEGTAPPSLP